MGKKPIVSVTYENDFLWYSFGRTSAFSANSANFLE